MNNKFHYISGNKNYKKMHQDLTKDLKKCQEENSELHEICETQKKTIESFEKKFDRYEEKFESLRTQIDESNELPMESKLKSFFSFTSKWTVLDYFLRCLELSLVSYIIILCI